MASTPPDPRVSTYDGQQDRRRHPRARADWPITLALPEGSFQARLRDVSASGVCFHLDRPVPEMSLLAVELRLPGDGPARSVRGRGVVVRCQQVSPALEHYEVAVFFNELEDADRELLAGFAGS